MLRGCLFLWTSFNTLPETCAILPFEALQNIHKARLHVFYSSQGMEGVRSTNVSPLAPKQLHQLAHTKHSLIRHWHTKCLFYAMYIYSHFMIWVDTKKTGFLQLAIWPAKFWISSLPWLSPIAQCHGDGSADGILRPEKTLGSPCTQGSQWCHSRVQLEAANVKIMISMVEVGSASALNMVVTVMT